MLTSSVCNNRLDQLILRLANDLGWSTTKQTGDSHHNRCKFGEQFRPKDHSWGELGVVGGGGGGGGEREIKKEVRSQVISPW